MTFNPDLVFDGGLATGDVKYKIVSKEWRRSDLYQAIAFATIYRTNHAAVIGFAPPDTEPPPPIIVGDMNIRHIDWRTDPDLSPADAADTLAGDITDWLLWLDEPGLIAVS